MNRRSFIKSGGALGASALLNPSANVSSLSYDDIRAAFPRMREETYLNAAGLMPLGEFSERGLRRFQDFQRLGAGDGRGDYFGQMLSEIRGMFATVIGAQESEVGLVHCTKAGEQIALDGIPTLARGGNIVTNDLHFSGSLHNLVGLRQSGRDVRVVRSSDWSVSTAAMAEVIDDDTALVCLSLVSNINGHVEDIEAISAIAHRHGALVYADIIQAAGIVPIDVRAMGIDVAACSCYKWLYGVHGSGFLFVAEHLQGTGIADRLYPGHARHNYPPWVGAVDKDHEDLIFEPPVDATRYQPGHVNYMGYCASYEGLKFLTEFGIQNALGHSVGLTRRLLSQIDASSYRCITPDVARVPIVTLQMIDGATSRARLQEKLQAAGVVVSLSGDRIRVAPAVFNNESDIDRLSEVLA